jgi:hypothetical protein
MVSCGVDAEARRRARANWTVARYRLGEEPPEPSLVAATPSERVAMVSRVTEDAWVISGRPLPDYARADAPGRVVRRGA